MAGKKNKGEAKGQSKRGAAPLQNSSVDDITGRLTGMQAQDELILQQDTLSTAAPAPGEAIQEHNLKAALDSPSIYVETTDNDGIPSVVEIEREVALLSPYVQREVLQQGNGVSHDRPIILPNKVTLEILELLLTYCRFHRASGRSDKERKIFDEKFIRLDTRRLCELTSAADALAMKPLVDLTSRALARLIEGKTPEQIRAQFQLPDDLTEEEKLEPVRNFGDDPKIRLLNRLYEKKRRELQKRREEEQRLIGDGSAPMLTLEEKRQQDERSVDELLSFIENGGGRAGATPRGSKKKKGKQSRKVLPLQDPQHNSSTPVPSAEHNGSMRSRQNAVPSPVLDRLDDVDPSLPVARKLGSTIEMQKSSVEAEQKDPTSSKSESRSRAVPYPSPVSKEDNDSLEQSRLKQTQQPSNAQDRAQQPIQQTTNGPTNRHLSEEDDAESTRQKGNDASEASDADDSDDEDEEDEEEAAGNGYQMRSKGLLSGSFGPLQGPFTTLTSLAAFRARFQPPSEPSTQSLSQEAVEEQASQPSLTEPAWEEQSSTVGPRRGDTHGAAQIRNPSIAAAPGSSNRPGSGSSHLERRSEAGHDRQHPRSASSADRNSDAASQHEESEVSGLWKRPADVSAARAALEAFFQESGLSKHMRIQPSAADDSPRRVHSEAAGEPHSQNGHIQHAIERRVRLSTGVVLQFRVAHEL